MVPSMDHFQVSCTHRRSSRINLSSYFFFLDWNVNFSLITNTYREIICESYTYILPNTLCTLPFKAPLDPVQLYHHTQSNPFSTLILPGKTLSAVWVSSRSQLGSRNRNLKWKGNWVGDRRIIGTWGGEVRDRAHSYSYILILYPSLFIYSSAFSASSSSDSASLSLISSPPPLLCRFLPQLQLNLPPPWIQAAWQSTESFPQPIMQDHFGGSLRSSSPPFSRRPLEQARRSKVFGAAVVADGSAISVDQVARLDTRQQNWNVILQGMKCSQHGKLP